MANSAMNSNTGLSRDCSTLTEVNSDNIPEVEIVSLLAERLPRYRLRTDYLSKFSGAVNVDFDLVIDTPVLNQAVESLENLSYAQAEATLDYLLLSGQRLTKMTQAFHDVDALTLLLKEKEKDLELAARIGQQLLVRNRKLEDRISNLESQLASSNGLVTQLEHGLNVKTELLRVYTDQDEANYDGDAEKDRDISATKNSEIFQKKIIALEEDNKNLKEETHKLSIEALECEEKEERLFCDLLKQNSETKLQMNYLSNEYANKYEECLKQKEEIRHLLTKVCDSQAKSKRLIQEKDELVRRLRTLQTTQEELSSELLESREDQREIAQLLHESQEQVRSLKRALRPSSKLGPRINETDNEYYPPLDSLQGEIRHSLWMQKHKRSYPYDDSLSDEYSSSPYRSSGRCSATTDDFNSYERAFKTFKYIRPSRLPNPNQETTYSYTISRGEESDDEYSVSECNVHPGIGWTPCDDLQNMDRNVSAVEETVRTIGELVPPNFLPDLSATELGNVPTFSSDYDLWLPPAGITLRRNKSDTDIADARDSGITSGEFPEGEIGKCCESTLLNDLNETPNFFAIDEDSPQPPYHSSERDGVRKALENLNMADVQYRRQMIGQHQIIMNLDDCGSEFGSVQDLSEEVDALLPYGINDRSQTETGTWKFQSSKLRMIKPLEGSLTLHNWSQMAKPHLGQVLDIWDGVAIRGAEGEKRLHIDSISTSTNDSVTDTQFLSGFGINHFGASKFRDESISSKRIIGRHEVEEDIYGSLRSLDDMSQFGWEGYTDQASSDSRFTSVDHKEDGSGEGLVSTFFQNMKNVFYGKKISKTMGIMEKIEQAGGVGSMLGSSSPAVDLSDFDELENIEAGRFTLKDNSSLPLQNNSKAMGQLSTPSFWSTIGRPSLNQADFGQVPTRSDWGIPAYPGTGALLRERSDLGSVPISYQEVQHANVTIKDSTSFMGNITSLIFGGRKGGFQ